MIQKSLRQSVLTYLRRGVQYASGLFPKLKIPLTNSVVPTIGTTPSFSRSTAATVKDHEGFINTALINELRFPGSRRVRNLLSNTEVLSTQTVTVTSGSSYILSFSGTGSVTLSGAATGTLSGSTGRVQVTKSATTSSLTLTVTGSVLQAQLEKIVGTQTQASEYVSNGVLSWPYHGACVDGVKYFATDRDGNSLDVYGALIEPSATNLITYSSDFSSWSKVSATVTTNQATAPDGTISADLISLTPGSGYVTASNISSPSSTNTYSIWLRSVSGTGTFTLNWYDFSTHHRVDVGLTTTWKRFEVNITTNLFNVYVGDDRANTSTLKSCYAWGAQVETGAVATSHIPTSGATVTKTADILTYGVSSALSQGQGSIYSEFLLKGLTSSTTYILSLDDATSSNRISLYISSGTTLDVIMTSSGSSTVTSSLVTVSKDSVYKIMVTYESNSFKVYINGTLILTDTSCTVPTTLSYLRFSKYDNSGQTNIQVKDFLYYKEVLKQAEAERRTS